MIILTTVFSVRSAVKEIFFKKHFPNTLTRYNSRNTDSVKTVSKKLFFVIISTVCTVLKKLPFKMEAEAPPLLPRHP